ncbi:hypothetical protein ACIBG8_54390 [Nonomuraea sp. NPDC050556]|uniref:hypothetical protein n=1 Tax=Nonomuraea sp. NPDC050556 TaxID=3364369 RepID=UPI00378EF8BC
MGRISVNMLNCSSGSKHLVMQIHVKPDDPDDQCAAMTQLAMGVDEWEELAEVIQLKVKIARAVTAVDAFAQATAGEQPDDGHDQRS